MNRRGFLEGLSGAAAMLPFVPRKRTEKAEAFAVFTRISPDTRVRISSAPLIRIKDESFHTFGRRKRWIQSEQELPIFSVPVKKVGDEWVGVIPGDGCASPFHVTVIDPTDGHTLAKKTVHLCDADWEDGEFRIKESKA